MELISKSIVYPEVPHDGTIGLKLHNMAGEEILQELSNTSWDDMWEICTRQWEQHVREYEADPGDFYYAWHYLDHHPAFWEFRHGPRDQNPLPLAERLHLKNLETDNGIHRCVDLGIVKVNPANSTIEEDGKLNTATEVWIELGKRSWPVEYNPKDHNTYDSTFHDYMLDCGGPTVETAIIRAAHNVWEVYGNDRRICDGVYNKLDYVTVLEPDEFDKLMEELGDDGEANERVRRAAKRLHDTLVKLEGESGCNHS